MHSEFYTYTSQGNRKENEDSALCETVGTEKIYAVLADGLGGHGGGRTASQLCLQSMSQCGKSADFPTQEQVRGWMEQANRSINERRDGPNRMKTTAVFLCICGNQAIWAHIGDSRLYHYYNGQFVEVTQDHSITQIAVIQGEITRDEMPFHPDRSRLIRCMGSEDFEPSIHAPVTLSPGVHAFLLCSDGVWETLREGEILTDLHKSADPRQWLEFLRIRGEKRRVDIKEIDNNTAVALFVQVD